MQIEIAQNAGFCFGVRRALNLAEQALADKEENIPLYTFGPLIHNKVVVEQLAAQGIRPIAKLEDVQNGILVLRSHGVGPKIKEKAEQKFTVLDATCPYVNKAQKSAAEAKNNGYQVVIFGNREHPEVIGLKEWSGDNAVVIANKQEAIDCTFANKVALLAQTTQNPEDYRAVEEVLREKTGELLVFNTICSATRERQEAARSLAKRVDLMLVIGDKNSANTNKLFNICTGTGTPTYHVEVAKDLQPQWFANVEIVGVTAGASTPDWIIEEVINRMAEFNEEGQKNGEQNTAEVVVASDEIKPDSGLNEQGDFTLHDNLTAIKKGDLIEGKVVQIKDKDTLVDIGGKAEGIIPLNELTFRNIESPAGIVSVGDTIKVMVLRVEDEEGHPILSKKRADRVMAWANLVKAMEEKQEVSAPVIEVVKGGVLVDVGVRGFVPASLIERGYVENLDIYLGKTLRLRVIELDQEKNKVVLSQKVILDEEYEKQRLETWNNLKVGDIVKGTVRRLTNFGAFVDINGVDGLLHVSELAWGRISHPKEVLQENQEISVKIIDLDREKGKISLSLKDLLPDPWDEIHQKYSVGSLIEGKVVRMAPFGVFIELEPGVEGLVHISQLADHRVAKAEDVVRVGEVVKVKVLGINQEAHKISLSIKEALEAKKEATAEEKNNYQAAETNLTLGDVFGELFGRKNGE